MTSISSSAQAYGMALGKRVVVDMEYGVACGAGDEGSKRDSNPSPAHLWEGDSALPPAFPRRLLLPAADGIGRGQQVPVALQGVHRKIEVGVDEKHRDLHGR